ncbi:MAG TPA: 2-dehydropantoate 2-reductase [Polyangiaceae bacterium]|nr:2-dehydropantoate 2-reductase [Polyangiaceae bacterium]
MRFAIIGVGGVGGYVGARLAEAGHEVTFVARGAHRAAIAEAGLQLHSPLGDVLIHPARVIEDTRGSAAVDCVILAVKAWQVGDAALAAAPLLGPATVVLTLQNGVEAPGRAARVLGHERVLGGVAKIISFVAAPGQVQHTGVPPALVIGELGAETSERVEALRRAFEPTRGLDVSVSRDIERALWEKYIFIAAWAGVGAVTRAPLGIVRQVPEARRLIEGAVEELERVARARGVHLGDGVSQAVMAFIDRLPPDGTASLQRDIVAGRPSELDDLTGAVVRLGAEVGVLTPVNAFLYAALAPLERRARGALAF